MAKANKKAKDPGTLVSARVPKEEASRYHARAADEHRKLAEVIRMLLSEWASRKAVA